MSLVPGEFSLYVYEVNFAREPVCKYSKEIYRRTGRTGFAKAEGRIWFSLFGSLVYDIIPSSFFISLPRRCRVFVTSCVVVGLIRE